MTPESQNTFVGERVNFTCSGFGSFINITWRFNDSLLNCTVESCTFNAISVSQELEMIPGGVSNTTITSILEVNTADIAFSNFKTTNKLNILCILTQILPPTLVVQGGINSIPNRYSSILTVIQGLGPSTIAKSKLATLTILTGSLKHFSTLISQFT